MQQNDKNAQLAEMIKKAQLAAEEREAERLANSLGLKYGDLTKISAQTDALELINEEEAKVALCAPFLLKQKTILLACKNPALEATKNVIEGLRSKGYDLDIYVVSLRSLENLWQGYRFIVGRKKEITGGIEVDKDHLASIMNEVKTTSSLKEKIQNFDSPYISQIFEIIIAGAIAMDASDIHIEPEESGIRLRYRLDGVLQDISALNQHHYRSIISRIKLLGGMKINVHTAPQDGRFTIKTYDVDIEVRVSIIPSAYGETVVMRLLNPKNIQLDLKNLGFREDDLAIMEEQIGRPNGIILNTGPTGSGKTTTLYAFLRRIYNPEIKIITVEDPIEYHLEGITQTQVNPTRNYTFASGLRSILRQDPDVILVGEIRDNETAEIAMHAALTGHLVFSTLHTNDACGTIPRLLDMNIQPAILAPALNLAIAQRLVRKLCQHCKEAVELTPEQADKIRKMVEKMPERVKKPQLGDKIVIYKSKGCEHCNGTGYKGRVAVAELLVVDRDIQNLITRSEKMPTAAEIKDMAIQKGMTTMEDDAILKILDGITSLSEAENVLGKLL
ncbi:MAG: GspE/PulE family protein [Patescibacteria group bacterium]|jgi:type II secretory ATPase GspE/PulE/Tfp pilus assembly ATPase PilB-like protein|nr:GspE/PulE family protein [Patescibacteria group bacterium]